MIRFLFGSTPFKLKGLESLHQIKNPQLSSWVSFCGERGLTSLMPKRKSCASIETRASPEKGDAVFFIWFHSFQAKGA
jgi:hypothetical protein